MKNFKYILLFIVAIALQINMQAQNLLVSINDENLIEDSAAKISSLTATVDSGSVYLKWTVSNQKEDGMYLVFSSSNGVDYENIGNKIGVGVPISNDIAYYFVDSSPVGEIVNYKLVHIAKNKTFINSATIKVKNKKVFLAAK